ncbi:FdtA/QdtA family cupin domain-containing protein [Candidatus Electrothrix gigas]
MVDKKYDRQKVQSVYDATLIQFPKILDPRGNLTFIEQQRHIPFSISRVYWIYDVPGGEQRGGHAFKEQEEVLIALSGSFDVLLDDGTAQKIVHLNRAYQGLCVPKMIWRRMQNFSTNAVAYVLASCPYKEDDYLRDYESYRNMMLEER